MNPFGRIVLIAFFFLVPDQRAVAQHIWYEISGGPAVSFVSNNRDPLRYSPIPGFHGGITAFFPFNNKVSLKTGALYQHKGTISTGRIGNKDTAYLTYRLESKSNYHLLNIPLQLAFNIGNKPEGSWRIAAGMSYGVLLGAKKSISFQTYEDDQLLGDKKLSFKPLIGSDRSDNYEGLPGQEGTPVRYFIPSIRLDVTYQWQERLLLSAFYEYDLEDIRVRTLNNGTAKLHYLGLSFGVIFW